MASAAEPRHDARTPFLGPPRYFRLDHDLHPPRALALGALGTVLLISTWWALSMALATPYLPSPGVVAATLLHLFQSVDPSTQQTMWELIASTLRNYYPGFLLAFALAVPIGILLGISGVASDIARPALEGMRPLAPIVFGPLLLVVFGPGNGVFLIVFLGVFIPLITQIQFGVRHIDPLVLDSAQTLGAHRGVLFAKAIIPAIVPNIMTGLKTAIGIGWICIIEGELIIGAAGLGYFILISNQLARYPEMFAGIVLVAVVGMLTYLPGWWLERVVSKRLGMAESAPAVHC